jgi:hypothetical protein
VLAGEVVVEVVVVVVVEVGPHTFLPFAPGMMSVMHTLDASARMQQSRRWNVSAFLEWYDNDSGGRDPTRDEVVLMNILRPPVINTNRMEPRNQEVHDMCRNFYVYTQDALRIVYPDAHDRTPDSTPAEWRAALRAQQNNGLVDRTPVFVSMADIMMAEQGGLPWASTAHATLAFEDGGVVYVSAATSPTWRTTEPAAEQVRHSYGCPIQAARFLMHTLPNFEGGRRPFCPWPPGRRNRDSWMTIPDARPVAKPDNYFLIQWQRGWGMSYPPCRRCTPVSMDGCLALTQVLLMMSGRRGE